MKPSPFGQICRDEYLASNELAFAIWDRFPVSPGHALVVPFRVVGSWWETSNEERFALLALIDDVRLVIGGQHSPGGYNIGLNIEETAGQTIDHVHIHVIPRYRGDVEDPRGGVRHVIPAKGNYLLDEKL
jgi:diadenosine tetraphosphate (Ap4A) HIT family hydrolase